MNAGNHRKAAHPYQRPAAVIVKVALLLPVIFGFTAFGIDMSYIHSVRNDLQRAADSAALAAAAALARADRDNLHTDVMAAAQDLVDRNPVGGVALTLADGDVVLGQATFTAPRFSWLQATENGPNAVQITLRKTADSPNGAVQLFFGRVIGLGESNITATARAVLKPRDIVLVCDLSGSMDDDSELRHYAQASINLRSVWDALGGPTFGRMTTWGTDPITAGYDPATDAGLLEMRYGGTWSSAVTSHLTAQGYSGGFRGEINALRRGRRDTSVPNNYANRVAVTLGLAEWHSGYSSPNPPATFPGGGDGDDKIEDDELVWVVPYPYADGSWVEWIGDYMRGTANAMYLANSSFRYRYGLKTFINFLLERKSAYAQTDALWQTPEQPLQAVKDAVGEIVTIAGLVDSGDQLSLVVYGTTARVETSMTRTFTQVYDPGSPAGSVLGQRQSNHYDAETCIGCGLESARQEYAANGRNGADKVVILLTDGNANVDENGTYSETQSGLDAAATYAEDEARLLAAQDIHNETYIYSVGVGQSADMDLMDNVAAIGAGRSFQATGTVAEYTAELRNIFQELGWKRRAVLF